MTRARAAADQYRERRVTTAKFRSYGICAAVWQAHINDRSGKRKRFGGIKRLATSRCRTHLKTRFAQGFGLCECHARYRGFFF